MRIVLDTNVLISGLLNPFGPPGKIVQMVSSGVVSLCYDVKILAEYQEALNRPHFKLEPSQIETFLDEIKEDGHPVTAEPLQLRLPDLDDEPFLEVAISGQARCLVTGNIKDYPVSKRQGMAVMIPVEFLDLYRKEMK